MSELSIKVNIANRVYPLSVKMEEEEEVRKAAAFINQRLKELESSFGVKDKLDLLAMMALELTIEKGHGAEELASENAEKQIHSLIERIDAAMASD
jgi:cell division protein ZapA (FtsZ GTPase activity inhibitor)